jgi:hypothetical protein
MSACLTGPYLRVSSCESRSRRGHSVVPKNFEKYPAVRYTLNRACGSRSDLSTHAIARSSPALSGRDALTSPASTLWEETTNPCRVSCSAIQATAIATSVPGRLQTGASRSNGRKSLRAGAWAVAHEGARSATEINKAAKTGNCINVFPKNDSYRGSCFDCGETRDIRNRRKPVNQSCAVNGSTRKLPCY